MYLNLHFSLHIYTNDQSILNNKNVKRFIYLDVITVQDKDFEIAERKLICLQPNLAQTKFYAFHLRNKEANRKFHVT